MPFEVKYTCDTCQPLYTFYKIVDEDPRKVKLRTPPCPQCKARKSFAKSQMKISGAVNPNTDHNANINEIIATKQAPAFAVPNAKNRAIDETAEIVMKDYNMTDINMGSHLRQGDNCVPKLTHDLEKKVDEVFAAKPKNNVMGVAGNNLTAALTRQIDAGHFRGYGDPVARQQADPSLKPKTNVMYHHNEKPN